jgi:glycosyltransferase involved in cell wall biosynthesis
MKLALVRGPFLNPFDAAPYAWLRSRIQVEAFAARRSLAEVAAVPLDKRLLRCPETELSLRHARTLNRATWFFGRGYQLLGLEERLGGFDVINTAETYFGFSLQAARAAKRLDIPLVVTVKETIPEAERVHRWRRRGFESRTKAEVKNSAERFIAVSKLAAAALLQDGVDPKRITVIPPGVDVETFQPVRARRRSEVRALFVGPVIWRKGIFEALRAVALQTPNACVQLTIVGAGADLGEAKRLAARLDLDSRVRFLGRQPYAAMSALYQQSDILLAPSIPTQTWQEQDSQAVLEAMACGLPVISSETGNRRELLGDLAYWSPPGNFLELGETLSRAVSDRSSWAERAIGARQRVEERHAIAVVGEQLSDLYREVALHRRPALRTAHDDMVSA